VSVGRFSSWSRLSAELAAPWASASVLAEPLLSVLPPVTNRHRQPSGGTWFTSILTSDMCFSWHLDPRNDGNTPSSMGRQARRRRGAPEPSSELSLLQALQRPGAASESDFQKRTLYWWRLGYRQRCLFQRNAILPSTGGTMPSNKPNASVLRIVALFCPGNGSRGNSRVSHPATDSSRVSGRRLCSPEGRRIASTRARATSA
jgi:hypothetical protein